MSLNPHKTETRLRPRNEIEKILVPILVPQSTPLHVGTKQKNPFQTVAERRNTVLAHFPSNNTPTIQHHTQHHPTSSSGPRLHRCLFTNSLGPCPHSPPSKTDVGNTWVACNGWVYFPEPRLLRWAQIQIPPNQFCQCVTSCRHGGIGGASTRLVGDSKMGGQAPEPLAGLYRSGARTVQAFD